MPTRGDKFAVVYVDGDVPQRPIQLGQLLVDTTLVSPGNTSILQCTDVDPVTYEAVSGGGGGTGTVTNVATGTGLTGGPITTTGTIELNAASIASLALADSATQPGDNVSTLTNDSGYLTSASLPSAFYADTVRYAMFAGAAVEVAMGTSISGAQSTPTYATTNALTRQPRRRYATTTAANNGASARHSQIEEGPLLATGFGIEIIFGLETTDPGQRIMVGFRGSTTLVSAAADPSALTDSVFFGKDAGDANMQIMHNDAAGTCTKVPLGFTAASITGALLRVTITVPVGGASVDYQVYNYNTAAVLASGSLSTNIPATSIQAYANANISNAATGVACTLEMARMTTTAHIG